MQPSLKKLDGQTDNNFKQKGAIYNPSTVLRWVFSQMQETIKLVFPAGRPGRQHPIVPSVCPSDLRPLPHLWGD